MEVILKQAAFAKQKGLFKAGLAGDVLWNLISPTKGKQPLLTEVSSVDFFVSHSWSCPSWMKVLAICYHLNLDLAIALSSLACFLGLLALRIYAGSLSRVASVGEGWLYGTLMCSPMAVFLLIFFLGHLRNGQTFWFDRICISEGNQIEKADTIRAIPAFVCHSKQMLVLWDETYLERLWCNYEMAVFAQTSATHETIFLPMWAPLWTLSTIIAIFLLVFSYLDTLPPHLDIDSDVSLFFSWFKCANVPFDACAMAAIPMSWFCFHKLHGHELMLDQMSTFDLMKAKCTLETDRLAMERSVLKLFDRPRGQKSEVGRSAKSEEDAEGRSVEMVPSTRTALDELDMVPLRSERCTILERFNSYVRGPLRDHVVNLMGKEIDVPLKLCLTVALPNWWCGLVTVLSCDRRSDCELSASMEGYRSVSEYMLTNAGLNLVISPLMGILYFPLALRTTRLVAGLVRGPVGRMVAGSLAAALMLSLVNSLQAVGMASLAVLVVYPSWWIFSSFMAGVAALALLLWHTFLRSTGDGSFAEDDNESESEVLSDTFPI
ncbi:unnamed protein product [Durusdinium trenchii]|uniref:Uncharacterized protein n=1 Tax=Durusdinium trenchii TaxID=1381693 RepID=A0ABP0LE65_9DINO